MHEAAMLAELIGANQPCVVLTGAGASTESGIPDFRSATGIWAQFDPYEVASIEGFRPDPKRVWEFYGLRLDLLAQAEPNPAHLAIAALETLGLVHVILNRDPTPYDACATLVINDSAGEVLSQCQKVVSTSSS